MSAAPPDRPSLIVSCIRWTLAWAFRLPTRRGRWWLARTLAFVWFDVLRYRRQLIIDNITIAFPDWPEKRKRSVGRTSLTHLCFTGLESFTLPFFTREVIEREVTIHQPQNYHNARALGRGMLVATLHLGDVEKNMAVASVLGGPLHVIAKTFRSRILNDLVYGTRRSFGTVFIDQHGPRTAFEILAACERNEVVAFVIDQFKGKRHGVETTFFGRTTGTAYGLALFALKTQAPVVPEYSYRDERLHLHVVVEPPVPPVMCETREASIRATTQRYNEVLEAIIRQHPEQWMWVHRRWKPFR